MSIEIESQHAATVVGFVRGGGGAAHQLRVSSAIGASWRRCMLDYSLDPARPQEHRVLDGSTL